MRENKTLKKNYPNAPQTLSMFDLGIAESVGFNWGFVEIVGFDLLLVSSQTISLAIDFSFGVSVEREEGINFLRRGKWEAKTLPMFYL